MAQNAQEEAFLEAFERYSDDLFRHCFFRISDRERALELVQDTFMKAWDYSRGGGEVRQYRSFLYRILNNLIIDEYRRHKSQSLDAILEEDPNALADQLTHEEERTIEEKLDDDMLIGRVKVAIKELPDEYRDAVTLRYIDGLSPKEIATLLKVSENVISVRIHRGLTKLRKICAYEA